MPLTNLALKNAKPGEKPQKLFDGGGLHLFVTTKGAKLWHYKYRISGKEGLFAIGSYTDGMSLAEAREAHKWARELVKQGVHPRLQRKTTKLENEAQAANTFQVVALAWIEKNRARWSGYYLRQVERTFELDVFPSIGGLPLKSVKPVHLRNIVKEVAARDAAVVAINIRQWCSAVFRHAIVEGLVEIDPTAALKGLIARPKTRHNPPLQEKDISAFKHALGKFGGYRITAIAIELLMLTFVRTVELRKAEWTEIDFDNALWNIPAVRMKMKVKHIVPLSPQSIALLRELETWTGGRNFLFPNNRQSYNCMSATTINRSLERMGYAGKLSGHGFRTTANTILHEQQQFRTEVIERQMAHAERNKVKAAYNHADYLAERKKMMNAWADFLTAIEPAASASITSA